MRAMISSDQSLITSSLLMIILSLHCLFESCDSICSSPSSCGIIPSISSPFRLKGDPKTCGDPIFELSCENNVTSISLNSHKYYVKAINYDNSIMRLVDASINNNDICSFPTYASSAYDFTFDNPNRLPYLFPINPLPINFISCPNPLTNSSIFTDITTPCASNSSQHHRYAYIKVGNMMTSEIPYTCRLDSIAMTSWHKFKNVSLSEIHESLLYGFELTVCPRCGTSGVSLFRGLLPMLVVILSCAGMLCAVVNPPVFSICGLAAVSLLLFHILLLFINKILVNTGPNEGSEAFYYGLPFSMLYQIAPHIVGGPRLAYDSPLNLLLAEIAVAIYLIVLLLRIIIFPFVLWLLIYKFRRRHLSEYNTIESFLQSDNKLSPIRYSYSEIKRMTRGFQEKLGEGGYGCVYKGKLRSGHHVAVKMLGKSGGNGQDFINEISTIGRVHHVNVVQLIGYCAQGSKRGLVFDFMPNGSLEKYLFNREMMNYLKWNTKFDIAIGIAQGIEYLHRGCDIQILHFDIKPHNILLDRNFVPKISDFGLAKLYSSEKKVVTLTAARGTIGYVAPELINRGIGGVSSKADVYSFGMLLMEMVGLNRVMKENKDDSTKYFPNWIYDHIKQGREIEIEKAEENNCRDENVSVRKMTIVALWCIQMNPDDRPSMNQVLQMLEGDVDRLQIPEVPSLQSTQIAGNEEESWLTDATDSVSLLHHNNDSNFEITIA
ncbi:LEAF RUST 10 DISEASE-RESISTANCE LOCUS RECEPTOR-LIKE PROTEIN KINASE-like 2.7 isoform X1 [Salvia splendens]|uniref:LEAF RUST 10 DISEASE-RESISTANCE LOCUS RECEPTOR-LIKE PROTEIN KINASE-like 2.7 isoform X1 n=1 Tax=Salvia splendens TaxID=180675 RepID=UPI001C27EBEF|nr:LEAF RUST 10 DISEASE-RESISTANCE LOCUS RECEPTOR-LIKE PROTEIN KINASE-like 2.7 isoform X1 [Salvia splendens]